MANPLSRYDRSQTYAWNYEHAPQGRSCLRVPSFPGEWHFCGRPVPSPLGIAAGPLLNSRWLLYYAGLGFDVLTYKTVRSKARACYPLPNLQPVECGPLHGGEGPLPTRAAMAGSWAVSFGMPSAEPDAWRADVERARRELPREKLLSVSVVGTIEEGWSIDDLAADYARCARWAVESGADCIETNFSCPNVATCDGQLYQEPDSAALVAARVREAIGRIPYLVKIGHVERPNAAGTLVDALAPYINGLSMTNSIATQVVDDAGQFLFAQERRGICGEATREASVAQTAMFAQILQQRGLSWTLVGVGGASRAEHVQQYLAAGANAVHLATAAMVDPEVGLAIRRQWPSVTGS
ncbi:MAG: hypothetical protein KF708_22375 [Pirellulales bacterium]|nr:hypothetical protein [Pirellulales bacterium]